MKRRSAKPTSRPKRRRPFATSRSATSRRPASPASSAASPRKCRPGSPRRTESRRIIMARYVDGFLLAVPKRKLAAYKAIATQGRQDLARARRARIRRERHRRCAERLRRAVSEGREDQARRSGGLLVHRLQVARASRCRQQEGDGGPAPARRPAATMPFDHKRMSWGGFKTLVDLVRQCPSRRRASCCIAGAHRASRSCSRIPAARSGRARTAGVVDAAERAVHRR